MKTRKTRKTRKNTTIAIVFLLVVILAVSGCGKNTDTGATKQPAETQTETSAVTTASPSENATTEGTETSQGTETEEPTEAKTPGSTASTSGTATTSSPTSTPKPTPTPEPTPDLYKPNQNVARERLVFETFNQASTIYVVNPETIENLRGGKRLNESERLLLQSLQGIVAQRKAEIYVGNVGDRWLRYIRENYGVKIDNGRFVYYGKNGRVESDSKFLLSLADLIEHYKNTGDIKGYIKMRFQHNRYNQNDNQINQACTLAGLNKWLIVSTTLESHFNNKCPDIKRGYDLSTQNISEYQIFKDNLSKLNKNLLIMQAPPKYENLREYGIAAKAGFYFYNSNTPQSEKHYVYSNLNMLANAFGWEQVDATEDGIKMGAGEDNSVDFATDRDVNILAADWCQNLTIWSSLPSEKVKQKQTEKMADENENTHYVTLLYSDGDNLQWMSTGNFTSGHFEEVSPSGKQMPFGWTVTPNMVDTLPHMIKYLYENMTSREHFVAPVTGYAYNHPSRLSDAALKQFVDYTGKMMADANMQYVALKGISNKYSVYDEYAKHSAILGGFIMYGTPGRPAGSIYWSNDKPFVNQRFYFHKEQRQPDKIAEDMLKGAERIQYFSTDKTNPGAYSFIQVHCWDFKYAKLQKDFYNALQGSNVKVVAPNEFMELIRKNITPRNRGFTNPH